MYGVVVRKPSGGTLQRFMVALDIPGLTLLSYTFLLVIIEAAMHHEQFDNSNESGTLMSEEFNETAYPTALILLTSIMLVMACLWLKKLNAIGSLASTAVGSISMGKAIAAMIEVKSLDEPQRDHRLFLYNLVACTILGLIIRAPYLLLTPVQARAPSTQLVRPGSRSLLRNDGTPRYANKVIIVYCGIILPVAIALAVTTILVPVFDTLFGDKGFYRSSPPLSESFGYSIASWGLSVLFMLRYFVPEHGFQSWRKLSVAAFILGALLLITAPSTPFPRDNSRPNVFASVSSLGNGIVWEQTRGAWGLVSSVSAVLLALTGPLRLDTKLNRRAKELTHTMRAAVFSLMLGCGLSWFLTKQIAEDLSSIELVIVSSLTTVISFLLTFSAVLLHTTNGRDLDESLRVGQLSIATSFLLLVVMVVFDVAIHGKIDGFRVGGCHSIVSLTCSVFLLIVSIATKSRKKKDQRTRALNNVCTTLSWLAAIVAIYGSFGLASIGVNSNYKYVMGIPVRHTLNDCILLHRRP